LATPLLTAGLCAKAASNKMAHIAVYAMEAIVRFMDFTLTFNNYVLQRRIFKQSVL
jgi:hypothetical protein